MIWTSLCGGNPFPLVHGWLSPCFQDLVLYTTIVLFLLVLGAYRLHAVRKSPKLHDMPISKLYLTKVLISVLLVGISLTRLLLHIFLFKDFAFFMLVKEASTSFAWLFSLFVVTSEYARGFRHNWIMRTWWTMFFLAESITLKYVTDDPTYDRGSPEFFLFVAEFALVTSLCLIGLFLNRIHVPVSFTSSPLSPSSSLRDQAHVQQSVTERTPLVSKPTRTFVMSDDDEMEGGKEEEVSGGPCRETTASIPSKLVFWWVNGLLRTGFRRPLQLSDMMELREKDKTVTQSEKMRKIWEEEKKKTKPSIKRAARKLIGRDMVKGGFFKLGNDVFIFVGPLVLSEVVGFLEDSSKALWFGIMWVGVLFVGSMIQSLCVNQYFYKGFATGMNLRTALVSIIYQKSFKLSNKARQQSTTGEIVNLQSIDSQKLADLMPFLHMVWSAPLQITIAIAWLVFIMGPTALAGLGIMIVLIPLNIWLARTQGMYQKRIMGIKDSRAKMINEILNGIRVIKFFVWEGANMAKVNGVRSTELKALKSSAYLKAFTSFLWTSTPILVAVGTFTVYTLSGHDLTPTIAFTSLALFNILRFPLFMLPNVISSVVEARVSFDRIQKYLLNEELDNDAVRLNEDPQSEVVLRITKGSFSWVQNENVGEDATKTASTRGINRKQIIKNESNKGSVEKKADRLLGYQEKNDHIGDGGLYDINLSINRGELVAIAGAVGAGKSSLISAFLGDIKKTSGEVYVNTATTAYVPQQAWIQNASVKENIIFGSPFDQQKYSTAVQVCELEQDVRILPDGDLTEIGEKGVNLSGGQKQRVSCARAVYQMADIYFFDDPLSAVDAHVGRNIFSNCIKGMLHGKTRVLVTHQLNVLPDVDRIIFLKSNGRGATISEMGTYEELMRAGKEFATLMHTYAESREVSDSSTLSPPENDDEEFDEISLLDDVTSGPKKKTPAKSRGKRRTQHDKDKAMEMEQTRTKELATRGNGIGPAAASSTPRKLMTIESRRVGQIGFSIYRQYLRSIPGGLIFGAVILLGFVIAQCCTVGSNIWLAFWSDKGDSAASDVQFYLGIYAALGLAGPVFVLMRSLMVAFGGLAASKTLHAEMIGSTLRAPMSFFDTTPIGRILNRFSKDIADVDQMVPTTLMQFLEITFSVLGTIVVISLATPWFLVPLVPLSFFYRYIQKYYVRSSRELKRLDSISKSPIFAHFSETLAGLSSIRAYKRQTDFIRNNYQKIDENLKVYFATLIANRWLAVRLEFVGYSVVSLAALLAVLSRGSVNPALAGLAISYSLSLTGLLNFFVRSSAEVENQLVAVERVIEYTKLKPELPAKIPGKEVPPTWPSEGSIIFHNLSMKYRDDLPFVLSNVNCTFKPREKVGIVGRTGSGKSSLVLALFRLVEPTTKLPPARRLSRAGAGGEPQIVNTGGYVEIDGVNTSTIGLDDLRSRLSIIPQDPTLFTGTVRSNVDPTGKYKDMDVWRALESVHMKEAVSAISLDGPVTEFGENFSVGQRQLLCMARALLKDSSIIVMDEATAAVDMETDALIQKTIRNEFKDRTVVTIAHRLNTIMDYDRVMVMSDGEVKEFDAPSKLLENPNSVFYSMALESHHNHR